MSRTIIRKRDLMPKWPLSVPTFTFWDKVKISKFIMTEDRWTQGEWVKKYEDKWKELTGARHAIMVASGSAANELIALRRKTELEAAGQWPQCNRCIFPAVTWISSISPWINFGFEPVFVDVSGRSMNSNLADIKSALDKDTEGKIKTIFYTTLLGFSEDLVEITKLCEERGVSLLLDNCESSFSRIAISPTESISLCSFTTCSTSMYFSHLTTTGTEGGMIFCTTDEEADWYRMARSHGMTRGMPDFYKNKNVDPYFDFYMLGSNYRSHNLAAYMGLLDIDRAYKYCTDTDNKNCRINVAKTFNDRLNVNFDNPHQQKHDDNVPMALPIVLSPIGGSTKKHFIHLVKKALEISGIEYRPLVSGNLLRQTAFAKYGKPEDFPNAEWLHHNAVYIGLHHEITNDKVAQVAYGLNRISESW